MNESLKEHVQKIKKLPTIPVVAQEILGLVRDDLVDGPDDEHSAQNRGMMGGGMGADSAPPATEQPPRHRGMMGGGMGGMMMGGGMGSDSAAPATEQPPRHTTRRARSVRTGRMPAPKVGTGITPRSTARP